MNIIGIPHIPNINHIEFVKAIGLLLQRPLSNTDIISIQSIDNTSRDCNKPTTLLVKFSNAAIKQQFIVSKRGFGHPKVKYFIKDIPAKLNHTVQFLDHMAKFNQFVYSTAKQFQHRINFKYVWFQNNYVLMKEKHKFAYLQNPVDKRSQ